jgi:hypothetical protein
MCVFVWIGVLCLVCMLCVLMSVAVVFMPRMGLCLLAGSGRVCGLLWTSVMQGVVCGACILLSVCGWKADAFGQLPLRQAP